MNAPAAAPFANACAAIRATIARDAADPAIDPRALPRFYDHGAPTERAIVLFHGLTNCPQQFEAFAQLLHARGATVYVPRLPRHGLADKRTRTIGAITAAEIDAAAIEAAQHARALGTHVAALGLSLGATMALTLAQSGGVDNAVGLAPFLMVPFLPRVPGLAFMRLLDALPDAFMWWDPRKREKIGPPYAYPGFWTHCLAQCIFAGADLFDAATRAAPAAAHATIVVNADDPAVNNAVARQLAAHWQARDPAYRSTTWNDLGRVHDVIDPTTYPNAPALVYPRLAELIESVPRSQ